MWVRFLLSLLLKNKFKNKFKKKNSFRPLKLKTSKSLFINYLYKTRRLNSFKKSEKSSFFIFKRSKLFDTRSSNYLNNIKKENTYLTDGIIHFNNKEVFYNGRYFLNTDLGTYLTTFTSFTNKHYLYFFQNFKYLTRNNYIFSSFTDVLNVYIKYGFYFINNSSLLKKFSVKRLLNNKSIITYQRNNYFFKPRSSLESKPSLNFFNFSNRKYARTPFNNYWKGGLKFTFLIKSDSSWLSFKIMKNVYTSNVLLQATTIGPKKIFTNFNKTIFYPRSYLYLSKTFFTNSSFFFTDVKLLNSNFFLLSDRDLYSNEIIRINRQYKNWSSSEFFFLKKFSLLGNTASIIKTSKVLQTLISFWGNDGFFETNYISLIKNSAQVLNFENSINNRLLSFNRTGRDSVVCYFFTLLKKYPSIFKFISTDIIESVSINYPKFGKNNNAGVLSLYKTPNNFILDRQYGLNTKKFENFFYSISNFEILSFLFYKPLFLKFFILKYIGKKISRISGIYQIIPYFYNKYHVYTKKNNSNLLPDINFFFSIKKKVIKLFSYSKFNSLITPWYFNSLIRFFEYCSGKKVMVKFYMFLNNYLNFNEKARCLVWSQKVKNFRRLLGPRLFLNESLQILYIALKIKDPIFLANWMNNMMQKISFWKYKIFLRYLKYVLRYFFWAIFKEINIKGIKFQLKGKISVAGNARTRTVLHKIGKTSHATFDNKIVSTLTLIRTFTGVLGLKIWIAF